MISASDRAIAIELIDEARKTGARLKPAYKILHISERTYQRWTQEGNIKEDQRPLVERPVPKNKLTNEEREKLLKTINKPEYVALNPLKEIEYQDYKDRGYQCKESGA
ncbi:hypothetical protein [Lutispora sp.]|uniref:hypothetical protein n=1 Tax=Lutispora sp. TaxID=2828727 RepID=UPI002B207F87|nr:hypothetical protein [Lutispora sp.]MEA4960564.1 hypothetical protein [Lutispora sp.]